jgi:hypothetical protein
MNECLIDVDRKKGGRKQSSGGVAKEVTTSFRPRDRPKRQR